MSEKPYKSLATDLLGKIRRDHDAAADLLIRADIRLDAQRVAGRDHAREVHVRLRSDAARRGVAGQIAALTEAINRNADIVMDVAHQALDHPIELRAQFIDAQQGLEQAASGARRGTPGPGM
ncbi:MAG: hypothetical protein BGO51_18075 [Rhodospirillales bacterium 69-11]|nr:MAG: hypothetical protein BGO51_18075 [Rhodospirillales bacterium 69-11]